MKDLRARLERISASQPAPPARAAVVPPADCFVRETAIPLESLADPRALRSRALSRIDAGFAGRCGKLPPLERLLFLDTETTGLGMGAGTVAFLIGLGWVEDGVFLVRQLLMRDYSEEPLLLQAFAGLLPRFEALVTYNGRTFDVPLLESRLIMHRMREAGVDLPHLDLLYPTRRVWRLRLRDCTLSNIERRVLDCGREEDLPGAEAPERFFAYLRTGDFALLEDVLRHNLRDVQTLGRLLARLASVFEQPEQQAFPEDVFSVGRALTRAGEREAGRACFRAAGRRRASAVAAQAHALLAHSHRRDRQYSEAEMVYQEMIDRGEGGVTPHVELAKIAEHRRRDPAAALAQTEAALERLALRERLGGASDEELRSALHLRRARLLRKTK